MKPSLLTLTILVNVSGTFVTIINCYIAIFYALNGMVAEWTNWKRIKIKLREKRVGGEGGGGLA